MQIISSYGVELRKQNIPVRQTLEIYRSAVSYLIGIYVQVWEKLAEIPDAKRRFNAAEHLVHTTKKNHACFDFDSVSQPTVTSAIHDLEKEMQIVIFIRTNKGVILSEDGERDRKSVV